METTHSLNIPFIMAAQAQKHVTHNEAIRMLDALVQLSVKSRAISNPPPDPELGERYIVPTGAGGSWDGRDAQIAAFQDGAWEFFAPLDGWRSWIVDENNLAVFQSGHWEALDTSHNPVPLLGVNTNADTSNRLAVASSDSLFSHEGADHRLKINKASTSDTAALLWQSDYQGAAEVGLAGNNDLAIKVSADGSDWKEALTIENTSGRIIHAEGARHAFSHNAIQSGITITPSASDPTHPLDGDIWYNSTMARFRKCQNGVVENLDTIGSGGSTNSSGGAEGPTGSIQYNDNGAIAGTSQLTWDSTNSRLGVGTSSPTQQIEISGSIALPDTVDTSTGTIHQGNGILCHSFGTSNLFLANSGNFTLSGAVNIAMGESALSDLTSGANNVAIGRNAGKKFTSGSHNFAIGPYSLQNLITGYGNVAIGTSALDKHTGSTSIGIGFYAGADLASGGGNVFIGANSGRGIASGSGNTIIGGITGLPSSLSNTVMIGANSQVRLKINDQGHADFGGALAPKSYTVSVMPAANSVEAGAMIFVSDEIGGPVPAFSDGTNWRRMTDRAVVA